MLKRLSVTAAVVGAFGLSAFAQAANPDVSVYCLGETKACGKNEIGITNNNKNSVSGLYVSCPDKNHPRNLAKFWSFDLDPNETKCYSANSMSAACYKQLGIFVDYNIEVIIKSTDNPNWQKTDLCTWNK